MLKILLIEDDKGFREQLKWALQDNYRIFEADSLKSSEFLFKKENPAVVLLDMGLENQSERGLEVIEMLVALNRHAKIIVITANTSSKLGQKAVAKGAFDYLSKPVEIDEIKILLERAIRMSKLEKPAKAANPKGLVHELGLVIIGESKPMQIIFNQIERLSKTDVNVLVTGESGTGKELCARAIHYHSTRKNELFVPINCGAIPEGLLESELFGYAKGAFTGANSDKIGLIESAHKGTLFLDEIGDMPKNLQVKLLRFLEDQKLQRIGENHLRSLDVRIVAATNKYHPLSEENEVLRSDLYYRLSEFEIHLPPLKDRKKDIFLIAQNIIDRNKIRFDMPNLQMTSRVNKILTSYSWPGNVRELENKLNRATITCNNQLIDIGDLQLSESGFSNRSLSDTKRVLEKNIVLNALKITDNIIAAAAKHIGVSRPTFYDLLKKHNIPLKSKQKSKK